MEDSQSKKYIFVCTGSDCKKGGSKKLIKSLSGKAKGSSDSLVVIKTKCMGHCKKGPNIILDNCLYNKVKENELKGILSRSKFPVV